MKKIAIIDYKVGNIESLKIFFKDLGFESYLTDQKKKIEESDVIILPGLGAFPSAIKIMKKKGLINIIKKISKSGKPIIGICLGMQLLATKSYEFEETSGLNLIPGEIHAIGENQYQIGWNHLITKQIDINLWYSSEDTYYFNHSYYYKGSKNYIYATTLNDKKRALPAIIRNKNIYGIQFHPEKSQESGKNLMLNLLHSFI
jgi:glutamine amidotransferase